MLLKLKKNFASHFIFIIAASIFISCASTKTSDSAIKQKAVLEKQAERMFWKIDGTDRNGNPSAIYVQGTFHLADEKCYPIADNVINAFKESDRIFGELSTEGNKELTDRMPEVYNESITRANGRLLSDNLPEEDVLFIKQLFGEDLFNYCNCFEPWFLTTILDTAVYTLNGFSTEYGIDPYFNRLASSIEKNVEGLDTVDCQIEALSFGTYDQQLLSLSAAIKNLSNLEQAKHDALEFYQAYLDGNVDKLISISFEEQDESVSDAEKEYNDLYTQKLILDRNEKWAHTFEDLLEEGGTTFVFAGTLHFIGDESVFKYMEKNGTLEIK